MSVLKNKAKAIADHLLDNYVVTGASKSTLEKEILAALKTAGSFQFMEGSNNEIMVKTVVKNAEGKTIAMQG